MKPVCLDRRCLEEKSQRYEAMKSSREHNCGFSNEGVDEDGLTLVNFSAKRKLEIHMQSKEHQLEKHPNEDWPNTEGTSNPGDDKEDDWLVGLC